MLSVPLLFVAPLGLQLLTLGRRVGALLRRGGRGVPTSPDGPWHASCGAKVSQMPPELNIEHQRAPQWSHLFDFLYSFVCNFQLNSTFPNGRHIKDDGTPCKDMQNMCKTMHTYVK